MDYPYELNHRQTVAEETTELILTPTSEQHLQFTPGQYVELIYPEQPLTDDLGNHRSFSLATAPHPNGKLKVAFRHSNSAFKRSVLEAPLGTNLTVQGPFGVFTLPKELSKPIVFIAGGIGITPFRSMLESSPDKSHFTLLYANSNQDRAAYLPQLKNWQSQEGLKLITTWGQIDEKTISDLVNSAKATYYYLAGPVGMTNLALEALTEAGVPRLNILLEQFIGYD